MAEDRAGKARRVRLRHSGGASDVGGARSRLAIGFPLWLPSLARIPGHLRSGARHRLELSGRCAGPGSGEEPACRQAAIRNRFLPTARPLGSRSSQKRSARPSSLR